MALNIKDPAASRLARELAAMTGESITEASRRAIEERLSRVRARAAAKDHGEDLMQFIRRAPARSWTSGAQTNSSDTPGTACLHERGDRHFCPGGSTAGRGRC